jgi:hypothetical protein
MLGGILEFLTNNQCSTHLPIGYSLVSENLSLDKSFDTPNGVLLSNQHDENGR